MTERITRTTLDMKMLDDLEATWHRIESDVSYDMQSALGILKEMMGYHYEQPVVAVYEGDELVGAAVYETVDDRNLGTRDTHISELASFTHKPGVGRTLVDEVIKIAREQGAGAVTASHGAGVKEFYERLGFVRDYRYPEASTLMMCKLRDKPAPTGTCYPDAWRFLMKQEDGFLIHGSLQLSSEGPRVKHAWVETTYGWVWEPQTGQYFTMEDFKVFSPVEDARYSGVEAAVMAARTGRHGPWNEEDRRNVLSTLRSTGGERGG